MDELPKRSFSFCYGRVIFLVTVLGRQYNLLFYQPYLTLIKLLTKCCVLEGRNGDFQKKGRDLKLKLQWSFSNEAQTVFSKVHKYCNLDSSLGRLCWTLASSHWF